MHDAYDRMRYMDGTERRDNSKKLYWLLGGLSIVIIVLIIAVVVAKINTSNTENAQSEEMALNSGSIDEDVLIRLGLADKDIKENEGYSVGTAIIEVYSNENENEALELFDRVINEAYSSNNFELFFELISYRAEFLRLEGRCDDALSMFDKYDVDRFSVNERIHYYGEAKADYSMCDNNDGVERYNQKTKQLMESEGIKPHDD